MKRPFISVVVPTMRIGGLDVLAVGLEGQTFRDFELVVSDGVKKHRPRVFTDHPTTFPVTHVEPRDNPFPLNAFCRYANTGLAHARGEVIVFVTDYTWLPPTCLETHAVFHKKYDKRSGFMGPHQYVSMPPLAPTFGGYQKDEEREGEGERYAREVEGMGALGWSIFETPMDGRSDPRTFPLDPIMASADPKLKTAAGPVHPYMFHGKNESCRIEHLENLNGWDEDLDGSHCYQDSDLAGRLYDKEDVGWALDPECVALIINPRHVFPSGHRLRPVETNLEIWEGKRRAGYPTLPNLPWSLRDERASLT